VSNREDFQEFASHLADGAQLSGPQARALEEHLEKCATCSSAHRDFAGIPPNDLHVAVGRNKRWQFRTSLPKAKDYRSRFLERARAEGIQFSSDVNRGAAKPEIPFVVFSPARIALVVSTLVLVGIATWIYQAKLGNLVVSSESGLQREAEQLAKSNRDLQGQLAKFVEPEARRASQVKRLEKQIASAREQLFALRDQIARAKEDNRELQAQLESANAQTAELRARSEDNARLAGDLKAELSRVRERQSASEIALATQQTRVHELSEKLAAQTDLVKRERALLAAGKEIRDLMGARNLHIIDVFDVDEKGRNAKAFGRVFYTEGKSLIFYAFDLTPRRHSGAEHAFQAWGYRDVAPQSARSLGVFYADDKTQDRWVLKFDDPEVLAEIDSVFVTAEPPGGSPKPTGQKLLYAYLNGQPNHP